MDWQQLGLLIGVLSPLVGVPLVVISLYLRAIRDHQTNAMGTFTRRIEVMEAMIRDLGRQTSEFEREYATKEEWVRESMLTRQRLERLTEISTRIQAELEGQQGLASELSRAASAMVELVGQLSCVRCEKQVSTER